jgi:hypothetical protein
MGDFKIRIEALDKKMSGWSLLETSDQIAKKIRMVHARGIYRHPSDNRTFHHLGTESIYALDREPNVNICQSRLAIFMDLRGDELRRSCECHQTTP